VLLAVKVADVITAKQEENLQNAMRVVRTSKLSINASAFQYKIPRRALRAYLVKKSRINLTGEKKFTFTTAGERVIQ
jgi:hypothetical protein